MVNDGLASWEITLYVPLFWKKGSIIRIIYSFCSKIWIIYCNTNTSSYLLIEECKYSKVGVEKVNRWLPLNETGKTKAIWPLLYIPEKLGGIYLAPCIVGFWFFILKQISDLGLKFPCSIYRCWLLLLITLN